MSAVQGGGGGGVSGRRMQQSVALDWREEGQERALTGAGYA